MLNSLEKLRGGFCDVSCFSFIFLCSFVDVLHFVVVSSFVDVLQFVVVVLHSHFLFDVIPHPSVDYRPFLYFQPSPSQSDSRQFQFSTISLSSCRALRSWVGIFLPTGVFYLTLLHPHFNLNLSRFPWGMAVLPWSLQGVILISKHRPGPSVSLIHSNPTSSYSKQFSFKFYYILAWIAWFIYSLLDSNSFRVFKVIYVKTIKKHFEQE